MRAVSVDTDAAQLMGIDVNRTISFTFALGSALAAAGGMMIGLYYNSIDPMMGYIPGLKSFIAAVLGINCAASVSTLTARIALPILVF
jgi:branched-chain amino acid transport system permease protein